MLKIIYLGLFLVTLALSQNCFNSEFLSFNGEDVWIEINNRTLNHYCDPSLHVCWNRSRTITQFLDVRTDIVESLNGSALNFWWNGTKTSVVVKATLSLKISSVSTGWLNPGIAAHLLDCEFDQKVANWECRSNDALGCCNQWRMLALGNKVNTSFQQPASSIQNITVGETGLVTFDVTTDLVNFLNKPFSNTIGYIIKKACESDPGCVYFRSCESGFCPRLDVWLNAPCPVVAATCPDNQS